MNQVKKPLFKPLIPGYETDLDVKGTYQIGAVYNFNIISQAQCETIIAIGSPHVRKVEDKKKAIT
jgi:hypothetical protein